MGYCFESPPSISPPWATMEFYRKHLRTMEAAHYCNLARSTLEKKRVDGTEPAYMKVGLSPCAPMQLLAVEHDFEARENHAVNGHLVDIRIEPIGKENPIVGRLTFDRRDLAGVNLVEIDHGSGQRRRHLLERCRTRWSYTAPADIGAVRELRC